jgi:hypothetical protein
MPQSEPPVLERDLVLIYALVAFLLAMPLLQRLFKSLWKARGFAWFPYIALAVLVAAYFCYGLRAEAGPLAAVALFLSIAFFPALIRLIRGAAKDEFPSYMPGRYIAALVLVAASGGAAIALMLT